ncbi:MAG: molecular chaperone DnaJ [Candidatus Gastranaerophilales bacterium]|nr:molecular chaperone DnaJ [Candidatus Gastranaerophilales bacterium]
MNSTMDYYEILGVEKNASKDDIKKAFRQKARQYHPDVNKAPDAAEKFKEIGKAYETLSDDNKREIYDRYGEDGLSNAGFNPNSFNMGDIDLSDIFSSFFGGGFGGFSGGYERNPNAPERGDDLRLDIEIDFLEACFGLEKDIKIRHLEACEECNSTGMDKNAKDSICPTCNGAGRVQKSTQTILGSFTSVTTCPHCRGTGKNPKAFCKKCHGVGAIEKEKNIKIKIPHGIEHGSKMRVANEGNAGKNGGRCGDLYVVIHVKPSKEFARNGFDIYSELEISCLQAILGDEAMVKTIHGESPVKIPQGTQNEDRITLKGQGVPYLGSDSQKGNHYITIKVVIPKKLSQQEEKLYRELFVLSKQQTKNQDGILDKMKSALGK